MTIGTAEFTFVSDLLKREAAIVLAPGKEYLVEARLTPLARAAGLDGVADLVRQAHDTRNRKERWAIVEALTTNETSWFRDAAVFEGFRTELLPRLLASRSSTLPLRFWSAAASTGQEAYSLAMILSEELEPSQRFEILGTDISSEVLAKARAGRYTQLEMNRGLPARRLVRYFQRSGVDWEIAPALRKSVVFKERNLAAPFVGLPTFDVVFMRNVLIYLDEDTKKSILSRLRRVMAPGGWLILGTAESTRGIDDEFDQARMAGLSAYQMCPGSRQEMNRKG